MKDDLYFSRDVIGRTIKDKRNPYDNLAYPKLDEVVSNWHYSGFRPTDAKLKQQ